MVVLPLLTVFLTGWPFGYASAPYNPAWARRHPQRAALMSLAGPGANLLLILGAALAIRIGMGLGSLKTPAQVSFAQVAAPAAGGWPEAVTLVLSVVFSLNLVLMLLNLIPVPPLDGYGALPLILPAGLRNAYESLQRQPMIGWIGILVAWRLFDALYHPVFLFAVNLLYPEARYG